VAAVAGFGVQQELPVFGEVFEGVGLDEVERVAGLGFVVDAQDLGDAGAVVADGGAAGATE